jgi:hypothetical protein
MSGELGGKLVVLWADMSEAGFQALHDVLHGNRVAIELVNPLIYMLEDGGLTDEDWQPIVLLPARGANLSGKNGLFRVPEEYLTPEHMLPSWKVCSATLMPENQNIMRTALGAGPR